MKINLGVIYGGNSTEHEISIISAVQAMNNIDENKYNIVPIYVAKDSVFYTSSKLRNMESYKNINELKKEIVPVILTKKNNQFVLIKNSFPYNIVETIDIAFPVLHGYNTEDGSIAGFLELLGIPYCESDIYASSIAQDKVVGKAVCKEAGISVVDYRYFYESEYERDPEHIIEDILTLEFPVIVKPARQGSSVGISIAKNKKDLVKSIEEALNYDEKILVEKVVANMTEINASVLGTNKGYEVSCIEQVFGSDEILSFKDKYMSNGSKNGSKGMASTGRLIPADIPKKISDKVEEYAVKACRALNTSGVVRIDFMFDKENNKVYMNEINIIPGSLSFYLWTPKGVEYKDLLNKIIDCGVKKYQSKNRKLSSFESNVLANFGGTKGVKK